MHMDRKAPQYSIPDQRLVNIEHPSIIQNVDRGIKSLGGERSLDAFLDPNTPSSAREVAVSLRPDDPFAQVVRSKYVKTGNVLLAIKAPKRTGRKRKRGSDDPFELDPEWETTKKNPVEGPTVLRSLKDNPEKTTVTPLGLLKEAWRFRSLPDFQYATGQGRTFELLKNTLMSSDLSKIKQFALDQSKLGPEEEIQPPPYLHLVGTSYGYAYRQNSATRYVKSQGKIKSVNIQAPSKTALHIVDHDAISVPTEPPTSLPPEGTLDPRVKALLEILRPAMESRPLLSRRVHMSLTNSHSETIVRQTWAYLGYMFRSGPFRDLLIRFGVDPRSDSKYRIYQSLSFQVPESRRGNKKRYGQPEPRVAQGQPPKTYEFDGIGVYVDGRVWQFCDITDPMLRRWLDQALLNDECEPSVVGWYGTGTLAIVRQVMKEKISKFIQGEPVENELYEECKLYWRDHVTEANIDLTHPNKAVDPDVSAFLSALRGKAIGMAREITMDKRRRGVLKSPALQENVDNLEGSENSEDNMELEMTEEEENEVDDGENGVDDEDSDNLYED